MVIGASFPPTCFQFFTLPDSSWNSVSSRAGFAALMEIAAISVPTWTSTSLFPCTDRKASASACCGATIARLPPCLPPSRQNCSVESLRSLQISQPDAFSNTTRRAVARIPSWSPRRSRERPNGWTPKAMGLASRWWSCGVSESPGKSAQKQQRESGGISGFPRDCRLDCGGHVMVWVRGGGQRW